MIEAAKRLEFSGALPGQGAFLLVKDGVVRSPVAVVFGYVDNESACAEIAASLSAALGVGTFECDAIC